MKRTAFEKNKLVYLPAILPSENLYIDSNGNYLNFWNKEKSPWLYKNLLVSTYHALKIKDFRKEMNIDDDVFILGDSGGFQMVTLGGYISANNVIKWQMANCDAGLILDIPPYEFGGSAQFGGSPSKEFFNKCLTTTKENAIIALNKNKGKNKIRLYGVIQGENWGQMNEWYNTIHSLETETEQFGGWALSPKPSYDEIKIVLLGILALENKINKPLHILQVSGKGSTIIAAYIRYLTQNSITIDSSSFSMSARYGITIDPNNIPNTLVIGDKIEKNHLNGWFCSCPICTKFNLDLSNLKEQNANILNLHNLYQYTKYTKYCDCISQLENEFSKLCKKASPRCYKAFQLLKYYNDNGLEKTKQKYYIYFNDKQIFNNQKQNTLMNL